MEPVGGGGKGVCAGAPIALPLPWGLLYHKKDIMTAAGGTRLVTFELPSEFVW